MMLVVHDLTPFLTRHCGLQRKIEVFFGYKFLPSMLESFVLVLIFREMVSMPVYLQVFCL